MFNLLRVLAACLALTAVTGLNAETTPVDEGGPSASWGGGCRRISDRWRCDVTPGCHWQGGRHRGECVSNGDGGGRPDRDDCDYIGHPRRCEQTRGCHWDYRRDRCQSNW